jgi:hypothetical protein
MKTEEMYNSIFGEGEFQKLDEMLKLKMIDFSTVCQQEGITFVITEMFNERQREQEEKQKEIERKELNLEPIKKS